MEALTMAPQQHKGFFAEEQGSSQPSSSPFTRPVLDASDVLSAHKLKPCVPKVHVTQQEGFFCHIHAQAVINMPPDVVFDVLTHPDNHAIFRSQKECAYRNVLSEDGDMMEVEVEHTATWNFMFLSGVFHTRTIVYQSKSAGTVQYTMIRPSPVLKRFKGSWTLDPCTPPGGTGPLWTLMTLDQDMHPAMIPPPPTDRLLRKMLGGQIKVMFEDMCKEFAAIAAGKPVLSYPPNPYKLINAEPVEPRTPPTPERSPSLPVVPSSPVPPSTPPHSLAPSTPPPTTPPNSLASASLPSTTSTTSSTSSAVASPRTPAATPPTKPHPLAPLADPTTHLPATDASAAAAALAAAVPAVARLASPTLTTHSIDISDSDLESSDSDSDESDDARATTTPTGSLPASSSCSSLSSSTTSSTPGTPPQAPPLAKGPPVHPSDSLQSFYSCSADPLVAAPGPDADDTLQASGNAGAAEGPYRYGSVLLQELGDWASFFWNKLPDTGVLGLATRVAKVAGAGVLTCVLGADGFVRRDAVEEPRGLDFRALGDVIVGG